MLLHLRMLLQERERSFRVKLLSRACHAQQAINYTAHRSPPESGRD